MKTYTVALAADTRSTHGEGPCWDAALQRLLWVDMMGCKVNSLDPITGANIFADLGMTSLLISREPYASKNINASEA